MATMTTSICDKMFNSVHGREGSFDPLNRASTATLVQPPPFRLPNTNSKGSILADPLSDANWVQPSNPSNGTSSSPPSSTKSNLTTDPTIHPIHPLNPPFHLSVRARDFAHAPPVSPYPVSAITPLKPSATVLTSPLQQFEAPASELHASSPSFLRTIPPALTSKIFVGDELTSLGWEQPLSVNPILDSPSDVAIGHLNSKLNGLSVKRQQEEDAPDWMADWIDCLENDFEPGAQNHNLASPTSSLPPFKNHTLYGHFNEAAEPLHFPPLTLSSPVTPGAAQYNAYHSYSLEPFLESSDPFTSPVPSRGSRRASMNSDMHSFAAPYINATTFETPSSHLQSRKSLEFNNLPPSHGNLSYISNRSASLSKSSPPPLLQPTSSITGQSGNNTFSPMSVSTNRSFLLQTAPSGYATAVAGGTPRGHPRQPMTLVSTPSPQAQHQQPLSPTSTTPISANAVNPGGWSTVAQSHAISSQGSARLPRNGPVYATSIHRSNMHVSGGTTTGIIPAVVMKGIKSKDPLKPGDWICPNAACRFHNFARRVSCVACGVSDKAAGRF